MIDTNTGSITVYNCGCGHNPCSCNRFRNDKQDETCFNCTCKTDNKSEKGKED